MLGDEAAAAQVAAPPASAAAVAEASVSGGSSEAGGGGRAVAVPGGFTEDEKVRIEEGENNSCGNRWPREETLALLKIRSEMDVVFRDSSLKGPLWEEVSRKIADLGYHRSAKKCKEKFENVYKYHRRTKEGRASKADGKTYRFFDQLEAFESINPPPPPLAATPITMAMPMPADSSINPPAVTITASSTQQNPFSASQNVAVTAAAGPTIHHSWTTSSSLPTPSQQPLPQPPSWNSTSSTSSDEDIQRRHRKKRKWKDLFERLMKDVMDRQEEMHKKFLETLDKCERERMAREEKWRVQELARMNRERDLLVQERSIAAAKDEAVMAFLQKISDRQNIQIPNSTNGTPTQMQIQMPPRSEPQHTQSPVPATPQPPVATVVSLPMTILPVPIPTQEAPKTDNDGGEILTPPSSSRWPKAEIEALITLRTNLDQKYNENGPKGPMWEEISAGMRKLGYNRNAKRCKEKWENINKYFKKVKESSKKRPEDSKTCPYFHQLDALYKQRAKNEALSNTAGFRLKPENNQMAPIMARPEQQWPLPPDQPPPPQQRKRGMNGQDHHESDSMDQNDEEDDYDDDEEDENEGDAYEMVTNKQSSSMASATATTAAATTVS